MSSHISRVYGFWGGTHLYDLGLKVLFAGYDRRLRRSLVRKMGLADGARVLDVACGTGANLPFLCETVGRQGQVVGVDLTPDMLERARQRVGESPNVSLQLASADQLPFPDASFDGVICTLALTVIPDYHTAIQEMLRVLKPGKVLAVSDGRPFPNLPLLRPLGIKIARAVLASDVERPVAAALGDVIENFHLDYHLGGMVFTAWGRKR